MAATLTPDMIDDFVYTTLPALQKNEWTDISLEYPEYLSPRILADKRKKGEPGTLFDYRVQVRNTGNASVTGMYGTIKPKVGDIMVQATVPRAKLNTNFSYDIDEVAFQKGGKAIISLLLLRKHDALNSLIELHEEKMFSAPSAVTTDTDPMGVPFWLQKDASTTPAGAFNGGNPSGFPAGRAGISSTAFPAWRNWTFGWSSPTKADLVKKIKRALVKTNFKAPHPHPELGFSSSDRVIYTVYDDVISPLEDLAESRNDNLKADVARYMNQVTVGGIPIVLSHYLDANDTSAPLYGVNWRDLRPVIDIDMRPSKPMTPDGQPSVRTVHYDTWMNYVCTNLRGMWVGSKA